MARKKRRRAVWPLALLLPLLFPLAYYAWLPSADELVTTIPKVTALMQQRLDEPKKTWTKPRRTVVPLSQISPLMVKAVVLSEDARFYQHDGFDWTEIGNSVEKNLSEGRFARGGSTLTQQLAKNLWLGTKKTLARKLDEAILAVKLERALSKERILEVYLNVVEWGPGVFGVESAARTHFGVSAAELRPYQVALLVGMLPAPRKSRIDKPSEAFKARARRVMALIGEDPSELESRISR